MTDRPYSLAIETSARQGSVTLGRGDDPLATVELPEPRRHTVDLVPTIDRLCQRHSLVPRQLGEVYVSLGPGSFTGLRIGIATAQLLAHTLGVKLVGVPSLDVVAQNAPPPALGEAPHLAVCLNLKRDTVYAGLFTHTAGVWQPAAEPALTSLADLLADAPRPLMLLGDPLPDLPSDCSPDGANASGDRTVRVLPAAMAVPRSDAVWHLARAASAAGRFTDPLKLLPLYVRQPEAVELWERRKAEQHENMKA